MRVKKPAVLILLILCLFVLPIDSSAAVSSTYEDYAECLSELGVFVGTGSGFELDRAPTRIEGLVMLIRLLGAENEAMAMQGEPLPFTDVPKWASGYVAYAYENGLTNGIGTEQFGSSNAIEAKAYLTFLLRSLGYNDQAGDFSYNNALTFAKSVGLISDSMYSTLNTNTFVRAYVAKTSYDALRFPYKGGKTPLIDKLMGESKISQSVGDTFKKAALTEPAQLVYQNAAAIGMEENMDSVVMISCYTEYILDDGYEPDIGSGVILSSDGRIVTNYHVIEGVCKIEITFNDGTTYTGNVYVMDYDKDLDLAILKIDKTGLTAAIPGDSGKVKIGDPVFSIGSPYGYINTVTEGIVSAIRADSIQISAAINPGNSGGGLFDANGKLIGIPGSGIYLADNLGFAVPIDQLSKVSDNQKILLADFYAKNSKPLPPAPAGLSLLYETETTALLKWTPVPGAEYYYIYYKTEEDEYYYYLDETTDVSVYGYLAVGLVPGEKYSFKVTAEKEERESLKSSALTFKKSSGEQKHGSFDLYYPEFRGVPDFGRLTGIEPYQTEANKYYYKINYENVPQVDMIDYGYLFGDLGYTLESSSSTADLTSTKVLVNQELNLKVILYIEALSDEEILLTIEIIK